MSSPSSSSAPTTNKANSTQSRTDKLKQLAKLRVDSAAANRKQVALEFQASKTGHTKGAAKEARKREEALKLLSEKEALAAGLDYERLKNLDYSMDDVDRWTAKLEAKKDMADNGFTGGSLY